MSTRLANAAVSITRGFGHTYPCRTQAALRKPVSNGALWATNTVPVRNSSSPGNASSIGGAGMTMASVIPVSTVMNGGIGPPGLIRVANSPNSSPPRTFTAPISVIPLPSGEPPVVSRSSTTNVTSCRGVPSSARLGWEYGAGTLGG